MTDGSTPDATARPARRRPPSRSGGRSTAGVPAWVLVVVTVLALTAVALIVALLAGHGPAPHPERSLGTAVTVTTLVTP